MFKPYQFEPMPSDSKQLMGQIEFFENYKQGNQGGGNSQKKGAQAGDNYRADYDNVEYIQPSENLKKSCGAILEAYVNPILARYNKTPLSKDEIEAVSEATAEAASHFKMPKIAQLSPKNTALLSLGWTIGMIGFSRLMENNPANEAMNVTPKTASEVPQDQESEGGVKAEYAYAS